jgi:hypothetical protein
MRPTSGAESVRGMNYPDNLADLRLLKEMGRAARGAMQRTANEINSSTNSCGAVRVEDAGKSLYAGHSTFRILLASRVGFYLCLMSPSSPRRMMISLQSRTFACG